MTPGKIARTRPAGAALSRDGGAEIRSGGLAKSGFSASGMAFKEGGLAHWLCHFDTNFEVVTIFTGNQNEGNHFLHFLQNCWSLG